MAGELATGTVRRMVEFVEPAWELRGATPADRGLCAVYRVEVDAAGSTRACYLKAPPDGGTGSDGGIPVDARIQAVLGAHTSIPVPTVLGVVDDHPEVPAPFYLMTEMPGADLPYEAVGRVPDDVLRTVARQVGEHLGELHRLDAVDSFGYVTHDASRSLAVGRPSGGVDDLTVRDGFDAWRPYLRAWVDRELERHEDSRFAALTPRLDGWCRERVDRLDGSPDPVLGRNDHGFHNLLVDPETGDVTAMLDWAYTVAVPPAFDVEFAAYLFGGAFVSALPDVRDRRDLVRDALLAGYRSTAPDLAAAVSTPRPLYELLAAVRVMNDFDQLAPRLPDGTADAVAEEIRRDVDGLLASAE